jgi:hypothetical protein
MTSVTFFFGLLSDARIWWDLEEKNAKSGAPQTRLNHEQCGRSSKTAHRLANDIHVEGKRMVGDERLELPTSSV